MTSENSTKSFECIKSVPPIRDRVSAEIANMSSEPKPDKISGGRGFTGNEYRYTLCSRVSPAAPRSIDEDVDWFRA